MNIISYNIRGLGRGIKWSAIRRMAHKEQIDLLCIQKTKRESIHRSACQALWGDREIGWESQPVNNTAGGLLCIWSEKVFKLQSSNIGSGYIMLVGKWLKEDQQVCIVNVYSPCDIHGKRQL